MKYTMTERKANTLMRSIAKKEGLKLAFLKRNEGYGGYNYGASAGDTIMLSPFVGGTKGQCILGLQLTSDCHNPVESMLITFFHELSHCKLSKKVPSRVKGYSWNDTSKYQYELWITMLGVEYAHSKYGIKFSDQTMKWIMDEAKSYINNDPKRDAYGLVCTKSTGDGYTLVSQWDFTGDKEKKGKKGRK